MPFIYQRPIHFRETDAAGVVYFANLLSLCHEAYEASLLSSGIQLKSFFSHPDFAIPITHSSIDFFRPLFCGDQPLIQLTPTLHSEHQFEIHYTILEASSPDSDAVAPARRSQFAQATTRHVCIHPGSRQKQALPLSMMEWLQQWGEP